MAYYTSCNSCWVFTTLWWTSPWTSLFSCLMGFFSLFSLVTTWYIL